VNSPPADHSIYISLGSNIEPSSNLQQAITVLNKTLIGTRVARIYQCPAVGFAGADFFNTVLFGKTPLTVSGVVSWLRSIEEEAGRDRSQPPFSSRELDLDLLLYDDIVLQGETLQLPRDEVLRHAFVMQPLVELAPNLIHPVKRQPLHLLREQMLAQYPEDFAALRQVDL